jgi:hypothetical protein
MGVEEEVRAYLSTAPRKLNIAMVHHHPLEHQLRAHLQDHYGPMRRGGELIEMLSSTYAAGRWVVVHGHKHIPQLVNATSASTLGPTIVCAGSLGAKIWDPISTVARNQFHMIDVTSDAVTAGAPRGVVTSFTWGVGNGWYKSERTGSGLPGRAGFGSLTNPDAIAAQIDLLVPTPSGSFAIYPDLVAAIPDLPHLLPADEQALDQFVLMRGMSILRRGSGEIHMVAREA